MHQVLEINIKQGFDPEKQSHLIWTLTEQHRELEIGIRMLLAAVNRNELLKGALSMEAMSREADTQCATAFVIGQLLHLLGEENPSVGVIGGRAPGWYCARCGHLDNEQVTFEERCTICGGTLPL